MINEKATVAALKEAYKNGFRVAFAKGKVLIRTNHWAAEIEQDYICPKILGAIVEMIGVLPEAPAAYVAGKDADPGMTCSLDAELSAWDEIREKAEKAVTPIRRTPITVGGYEIWQTGEGLRARPMSYQYTRIIELSGTKQAFIHKEGDELGTEIFFKGFCEMAVVSGVVFYENAVLNRIEGFPWMGEGS